jgi:hypothetical protein
MFALIVALLTTMAASETTAVDFVYVGDMKVMVDGLTTEEATAVTDADAVIITYDNDNDNTGHMTITTVDDDLVESLTIASFQSVVGYTDEQVYSSDARRLTAQLRSFVANNGHEEININGHVTTVILLTVETSKENFLHVTVHYLPNQIQQ